MDKNAQLVKENAILREQNDILVRRMAIKRRQQDKRGGPSYIVAKIALSVFI